MPRWTTRRARYTEFAHKTLDTLEACAVCEKPLYMGAVVYLAPWLVCEPCVEACGYIRHHLAADAADAEDETAVG